jgi:hypothetical protein
MQIEILNVVLSLLFVSYIPSVWYECIKKRKKKAIFSFLTVAYLTVISFPSKMLCLYFNCILFQGLRIERELISVNALCQSKLEKII